MSQYAPDLQKSDSMNDSYSNKNIVDLFNKTDPEAPEATGYSPATQQAVATGLQAGQAGGGLGGMLTGAGASAALAGAGPVGWGVMAGGLLLSAHDKKKQEEAAREQARIQAEMNKRDTLIRLAVNSANQDFKLA